MIPFNHLGMVFNAFGSFVYPKSVRESLCEFLKSAPPKAKVLDIGTGTGLLCKFGYACRDDVTYVAIDPAEGMMKYAKAYVETHIATAEDLPFEANSFDVAMMGESLHHFRNVDEALLETVRVLKNGARLFIYDFDVKSFMGKSICKGEMLLGEPGNFFTPQDLQEKLESYGFVTIVKKHGWQYTVDARLEK
jgi:demethylmenaquinone methyltransferase/2-methoxy-6-polyprenyl-1,4-benzoquinol methylase